ncbi:Alpha/beta hydrolase fold-3 [Penicillium occitanis (nom. inval.)]|nr:Alpha/beta hydrolase fold-3 [Penicillium occitanis (nom. inval.)]PCG92237.1 hypothetical protein PENOC_093450 [Penicillium occitanis (nom. inval.)]
MRNFRGSDDHIIQRRATFQKLAAEGPQIRKIPGNDEILVRSYTPRRPTQSGSAAAYPVFVDYHGDGYTFGDIETGDDNFRLLSARNGLAVLNVDYRLAPRYLFPKGFEDAYGVLRWVTKNAPSFAGDMNKGFLVGGVSAGGNFAGALANVALDEGLQPPITRLLLSIPCCLMPQAFHLLPQYKDERLDPIRDNALLFAKLLREQSNAETKIDLYDDLPHGFWRFQKLPAAQRWHIDIYEGTKFLLEGGKGGFHVNGTENGLNEYLSAF